GVFRVGGHDRAGSALSRARSASRRPAHAPQALRAGDRAGLHRGAAPGRLDGDVAGAPGLQLGAAAHPISAPGARGRRSGRHGAGGRHRCPLSCALATRARPSRDVSLTPLRGASSMTILHANGTRRRVVVTGIGLVTPLGTGTERNWEALVAGRSGVREITRFDASNLAVRIAGEVPDFAPERFIERKDLKKMDVFIQYAVAAAQMAMQEAGLEGPFERPERAGVIVGVGMGGLGSLEAAYHHFATQDVRRVSPFFIPKLIPNMASGHIAMRYGARGPSYATTSACASGAHAIGDAVLHIRDGRQDIMLAGGA